MLLCQLGFSQHIFSTRAKKNTKKPRVWSIKPVKEPLGPEICSNILFLHAVLGCDTTSHLYGIGKGTSLKKFTLSRHFREQAKVFATESATPKEIYTAGEQALVILYNGTLSESLDYLSYKRFYELYKHFLYSPTNPPTSAAAKYHSLRVYFQILEWKGSGDKLALWNGDGRVMENLCQYSPTCHQLQMSS